MIYYPEKERENTVKKQLLKLGLLALNALVPVFIAACYGVNWICLGGRVRDRETGKGINGIRVTCLVSNGPSEFVLAETTTRAVDAEQGYCGDGPNDHTGSDGDADGDADWEVDAGNSGNTEPAVIDGVFQIDDESLRSCPMLRFTDVDGPSNGSYKELTLWDYEFNGTVDLEPIEP
jgi:hypothetical protein